MKENMLKVIAAALRKEFDKTATVHYNGDKVLVYTLTDTYSIFIEKEEK